MTDKLSGLLFRVIKYIVRVTTGSRPYHGTDARIYIKLYGSIRESAEIELVDSDQNAFEMGSVDVFPLDLPDLGDLEKVHIRQDNSGDGAEWYLKMVEVENSVSKRNDTFNCNNWLDEERGLGTFLLGS